MNHLDVLHLLAVSQRDIAGKPKRTGQRHLEAGEAIARLKRPQVSGDIRIERLTAHRIGLRQDDSLTATVDARAQQRQDAVSPADDQRRVPARIERGHRGIRPRSNAATVGPQRDVATGKQR